MSTFIIGLLISDFECTQANWSKSFNVSACSRPNAIKQLDYALSISKNIIEYLEDFCDYSYPILSSFNEAV